MGVFHKKWVKWLIALLVALYVVHAPAKAASKVNHLKGKAGGAGNSLSVFVDKIDW